MRSLRRRGSPNVPPRMPTPCDMRYIELVQQGMTPKDAAKIAQAETGLSKVTGQSMKSRGFGWQQKLFK